ncbi:hypothetical protein ACFQ23_02850, partial [Schaalia naturae]
MIESFFFMASLGFFFGSCGSGQRTGRLGDGRGNRRLTRLAAAEVMRRGRAARTDVHHGGDLPLSRGGRDGAAR